MNIATDSAGLIVMWSDDAFPTPPQGGSLFTLTNAQGRTLVDLFQRPNGGITFDGESFVALPAVTPPVIDLSDADNLEKALKAILLASAALSGKTVAQARSAFTTAYKALP